MKSGRAIKALTMMATAFAVMPAFALQELSDSQMSHVVGRDGISIDVSTPGVSVGSYGWCDGSYNFPGGVVGDGSGNCTSGRSIGMSNMSYQAVDVNGNPTGGNITAGISMDVGYAAGAPTAGVSLSGYWSRMKFTSSGWQMTPVAGGTSYNYGDLVLESAGTFKLWNTQGLFSSVSTGGGLDLSVDNARLYYRQNNSELLLNNLYADTSLRNATISLDPANGFVISGADLTFNPVGSFPYNGSYHYGVGYNLGFRNDPTGANPGDTAWGSALSGSGAQEAIFIAFGGSISNLSASVKGGGDSGTGAVNNNGVGDYVSYSGTLNSDFQFYLGEPTDVQGAAQLIAADWRAIDTGTAGAGTFGVNHMTLDVLGSNDRLSYITSPSFGFGTGVTSFNNSVWQLPAITTTDGGALGSTNNATALALTIRGMYLKAIATNFIGLGTNYSKAFRWAFGWTSHNLDANVVLYPAGENPGCLSTALCLDALMDFSAADTSWANGTNLFIGDTDPNGDGNPADAIWIGFRDINMALRLHNASVYLKSADPAAPGYWSGEWQGGSGDAAQGGDGNNATWTRGLQISTPTLSGPNDTGVNAARLFLSAQFAGGDMFGATPKSIIGADIEANIIGSLSMLLSPQPYTSGGTPDLNNTFVGYSGVLNLTSASSCYGSGSVGGGGVNSNCSYISFAEPSQPDTKITLGGITGQVTISQGRLNLTINNSVQTLQFSQTFKFANPTDANYSNNVAKINSVEFNGQKLGSIVIPGGQLYTSFTLKPQ